MRILLISILGLLTLASCTKQEPMEALIDRVFTVAEQQYTTMDTRLTEKTLPRTLSADGEFVPSNIYWWCSGFYPGSLWYIYEYTGNEAVKTLAEKNTLKLDSIQYVTRDHDVGFQLNCSYGNAFRLTGNEAYKQVLYQGAKSLSTRFNPAAGVIRSWDFVRKGCDWKFPVIIDNMMNLELLFWSAKNGGNKWLYDVAVKHAETTMKYHFRTDHSCYHVAVYDTLDGHFIKGVTHQGLADSTMWARGQAWAIYGYTMVYRETRDVRFLEVACQSADAYLRRLPEDMVPYWDFDAPMSPLLPPKDASAAAVTASALIELSGYVNDEIKSRHYLDAAIAMLENLSSSAYQSGTVNTAFLLHSVGHMPRGREIDASIMYADYYYIEALLRLRTVNKGG